jgi:hypothetical protein
MVVVVTLAMVIVTPIMILVAVRLIVNIQNYNFVCSFVWV